MRVKVSRSSRGHRAHIEPHPGTYVVAGGATAEEALHGAARLLDTALSNPVVAAALPPGTVAAVRLLRSATAAIRRGNLDDFLTHLAPAAVQSITRTLRRVLPW